MTLIRPHAADGTCWDSGAEEVIDQWMAFESTTFSSSRQRRHCQHQISVFVQTCVCFVFVRCNWLSPNPSPIATDALSLLSVSIYLFWSCNRTTPQARIDEQRSERAPLFSSSNKRYRSFTQMWSGAPSVKSTRKHTKTSCRIAFRNWSRYRYRWFGFAIV